MERGLAWITINRPERFNAFRARTVDELVRCFKAAWADTAVGVIALTGAGEQAFCAGGDQKQRQETGDYGPTRDGRVRGRDAAPRDPRRAQAGDRRGERRRGRRRPRAARAVRPHHRRGRTRASARPARASGSFDAGFGSAYLARILGEKRAREVWYLCRLYDAATMERWDS